MNIVINTPLLIKTQKFRNSEIQKLKKSENQKVKIHKILRF